MTEESSRESSLSREKSSVGDKRPSMEEQETTEPIQDKTFTAEEAIVTSGVGAFQVKLIVLCGFIWMARGFDVTVLKSVSSLLTCEWRLQRWQGAVISTVTFLSAFLGCFLYGIWSDHYGRRMALSSSLVFTFVFAAVSAGLRTYVWFVLLRAVAAFANGGLPQSLVLCCEYMPGRQRGRAIYILSCFFAIGTLTMMYVLFGTAEMDDGWRIFVAVGVLPAFIAMIMMRFFPESFRFLMVKKQDFAANEIVVEMIETNRKSIRGKLISLQITQNKKNKTRSFMPGLFGKPFLMTTLLLWIMGLTTAITFVGLNIMTQTLIPHEGHDNPKIENVTMNFLGKISDPIPCILNRRSDDFIREVWTTALDFPGFVIYMILVDVIKRKILLSASYVISSIFIFFLCIPTSNYIAYIILIYIPRMLLLSQFDLLLLITAETFPTSHRGTAVGLEASSFYLGRLFSSYILQSLSWVSYYLVIVIYGVLMLLCAVAGVYLKFETRGKELTDIMADL